MTPLEAIAEALSPHVWDNDPDLGRYCLRFLRSLKASGYELAKAKDVEAQRRDVATDPLRHLKTQAEAYRKAKETREEK